jgi:hypothetical protein
VLSVIGIAAYSVYNTYFQPKYGQAPGKMVAGIRVLKTDGQPSPDAKLRGYRAGSGPQRVRHDRNPLDAGWSPSK